MDTIVIEKFWKNVEKTSACWNWTGSADKRYGIPIFRIGSVSNKTYKEYYPRRISLELVGIFLDSKTKTEVWCNNNLCINPDHIVHDTKSRFLSRIQKLSEDNGGCWVWLGALTSKGYGTFTANNKDIRAHRYSYELFLGQPISNALFVCHKCDHRYCVNPDHLFIGTQQDNMDDMVQKHRQSNGISHYNSKLSEEEVRLMRELRQFGLTIKQISHQFNVSEATVSKICLGIAWQHIPIT